jgi:tRNA (guanine37-N1)-methyltransferase
MIEAITRLIPGVLGNPESLVEESHNEEGYLEYPNFTKPSVWRDLEVPAVLLSGNHGEIAKWRAAQAAERAKKNL